MALNITLFIVFIILCNCANGHMYLSSLKIGNEALPEGECVRLTKSNSPIPSITDAQMTCGYNPGGTTSTTKMCPVEAEATMGLQWYHNGPTPNDDIVDPSHRGPCIVYMAKNDGNYNWFKVYENGYDTNTKKFCVDTLIANKGLLEFVIPGDIKPGNYLVRGEVIALHEAFTINKAQPYVGCAELVISGKGSANPSTVKLPGAYSANDPGILFNIYPVNPPYVVPGPPVYKSSPISSSGGSGSGAGNSNPDGKPSGGMSAGGTAALVIFFLVLVSGIAYGAFYYHKNGNIFGKTLPSKLHNALSSSNAPSHNSNDRRDETAYTAMAN